MVFLHEVDMTVGGISTGTWGGKVEATESNMDGLAYVTEQSAGSSSRLSDGRRR